jgi:uncharacterized membrane protein YcfT
MHALLGVSAAGQTGRHALPSSDRSAWADAAKGLCILLVVSWHVIWKHYLLIDWRLPVPIPEVWSVFGRMLLPMRMPLFFVISGMFAATAVNRPWKAVARSRVAKFGYLYVVWLGIHTAILAPIPIAFDTEIARDAGDLLEQLTISPTTLWYLFGLAVYFVVAKLLRKVPMTPVLMLALALSTASAANWIDSPGNRAALYQNLFFFLCGLYLRPHVENLAHKTNWWRVAAAGLCYAVMLGVLVAFKANATPGVWPLASIAATIFGILVMSKVALWKRTGQWLAVLGRQTLPIYVIHMPMLALAHWLLLEPLAAGSQTLRFAAAALEPVVLTAALVAFCLTAHRLLLAAGADWLFDLPARERRKPQSMRVAPAEPETELIPILVGTAAVWPVDDYTAPLRHSSGRRLADDVLTAPIPWLDEVLNGTTTLLDRIEVELPRARSGGQ